MRSGTAPRRHLWRARKVRALAAGARPRKQLPARTVGIAMSRGPTRVFSARGRCPLGWVAGAGPWSPGSAPMEAVASASIRRCDGCSSPQGVKQAAPGCRVVAITFRSPIWPARVEGPHLGIIYSAWPDTLFWEPGGPVVRPAPGQPLSQAQLDVLFTLVQISEGSYRANIAEELELSLIAERLRSGGRP